MQNMSIVTGEHKFKNAASRCKQCHSWAVEQLRWLAFLDHISNILWHSNQTERQIKSNLKRCEYLMSAANPKSQPKMNPNGKYLFSTLEKSYAEKGLFDL